MSKLMSLTVFSLASALWLGGVWAEEEPPGQQVIPVTLVPKKEDSRLPEFNADVLGVSIDNQNREIFAVHQPQATPLYLGLLIQDDLTGVVTADLGTYRTFLKELPTGSNVMIAYARVGSVQITQEFSSDHELIAEALRVPAGTDTAAPASPYLSVSEVLEKFPTDQTARKVLIFVSDGLDLYDGFGSASPAQGRFLQRAIREAQRRDIVIYPVYAPTDGVFSRTSLGVQYGQGSLTRLAVESGGEPFFTGSTYVSAQPHLRKVRERLDQLYLVEYRAISDDDFERVRVRTEYDDVRVYAPEMQP